MGAVLMLPDIIRDKAEMIYFINDYGFLFPGVNAT